jgi:hypothetical protein
VGAIFSGTCSAVKVVCTCTTAQFPLGTPRASSALVAYPLGDAYAEGPENTSRHALPSAACQAGLLRATCPIRGHRVARPVGRSAAQQRQMICYQALWALMNQGGQWVLLHQGPRAPLAAFLQRVQGGT